MAGRAGISRSVRCALAAFALALAGCSSERDLPHGEGVHPDGWADQDDAEFHGVFLGDNGYPLDECRACHGGDYLGGDVGVSCVASGCHTDTVDRCGTCHGAEDDPRPVTGAHAEHAGYCATCHPVPAAVAAAGHIDGTVDLVFSGLAVAGGATPVYDGTSCSGSYCHQLGSPAWEDSGPLACSACHTAPPDSHVRFARVAADETSCTTCHPGPTESTHVDGAANVGEPACNTCHGGSNGVPPPALDGSTDPTTVGVGAHRRHTDSLLPGRIGRVVPCARCHTVPGEVRAAGHLDGAAPADVTLPLGGNYDSAGNSCVVWCHWDNDPGPTWTDDSGAARACDACHGYPPVQTRIGTPHPPATPDQCTDCHVLAPATHVDGKVDFQ